MTGWLLGLSLLSVPARFAVGLDVDDARSASQQPLVSALLTQLDGVEVRRLSRSVVVDVPYPHHIDRIRDHPTIRWVEPDPYFPVRVRAVPDDPLYESQWHLHDTPNAAAESNIQVEGAWEQTVGVPSNLPPIRVAVLDDGFDLLHTDLAANWTPMGRDFSVDPFDDDPSPGPLDLHGTQTAGVIAGVGFNGVGVSGVCPACHILPIRLIGNGGPPDLYTAGSTVAAAIEWAVDQGAAVLNNSWGPPDGNRFDPFHPVETWPLPATVRDALGYAARKGRGGLGAVITWSAGNGAELATYDGFVSDPRVIGVGSIHSAGYRTDYSDYGPPVRLVAPSSGTTEMPAIVTTDLTGENGRSPTDYTAEYGGTSASSAMVAGVAALVLAAHPERTSAQIMEILFDSAYPIDSARAQYVDGRSSRYGYGRVDAVAALTLAAQYVGEQTRWLEVCGNGRDDNGDGTEIENCNPCVPDHPSELCDGRDNNCDGAADELFVCEITNRPVCAPCTTSAQCALGSLCRAAPDFRGTWCFAECVAGQCPPGFSCDGEVCLLVPSDEALDCLDRLQCSEKERCDGMDNDCNGTVDDVAADSLEALVAARDCGDQGVCAGQTPRCENGHWQCDRDPNWEAEETRCDGLDNDCDGAVDEVPDCHRSGSQGCCNALNRSPSSLDGLGWLLMLLAGTYRTHRRPVRRQRLR